MKYYAALSLVFSFTVAQAQVPTEPASAPASAQPQEQPVELPEKEVVTADQRAPDSVAGEMQLVQPTGALLSNASSDRKVKYSVALEKTQSRFNLGFYSQFSQFSRSSTSFFGAAFEVLAGYALTEKISANLSLYQALDIADGLSVLASGIRSALAYAIIGQAYKEGSILKVDGSSAVSYHSGQKSTLTVDFGFDQVFFNGSAQVTPATGFSTSLRFDHKLWMFRVSWIARYGSLVLNKEPLTAMTAGMGVLFRF